MRKTLVTIASVVGIGFIGRGFLRKAVRKILKDELVKMEENKTTINIANEYLFETRNKAEKALDDMIDICGLYSVVTVADLDTLMGIEGRETDSDYGWTDLNSVYTKCTLYGFALILPNPIKLAK